MEQDAANKANRTHARMFSSEYWQIKHAKYAQILQSGKKSKCMRLCFKPVNINTYNKLFKLGIE